MKNNEQHAIDISVRQALENLEIPYKADIGILMAGKLDMLDAEETEFDKNAAALLAPLEIPLQAAHWQQMVSNLDILDTNEKIFDDGIANKLANIKAPLETSNWVDISARLDDLDKSETQFDALLSRRLENIQAKYEPKHWEMMAEKIEQTFSWRAKIVRYKVIEVALVLLTLFTVGNILDLPFDFSKENNIDPKDTFWKKSAKGDNKTNDINKKAPTKALETTPKSFNNATDWRNRPVSPNSIESKNVIGKPIVATENLNPDNSSAPNKGVTQVAPNILSDKSFVNSKVENPSIIAELTPSESTLVRNTEGGLKNIPLRKILAIGRVTDGNEEIINENTIGAVAIVRILQPMDILKPSLLNSDFYDENILFPRQLDKKPKWRLNVFGLPIGDMVAYNYVV